MLWSYVGIMDRKMEATTLSWGIYWGSSREYVNILIIRDTWGLYRDSMPFSPTP